MIRDRSFHKQNFYGFGKEGDPIPTCFVKLTIFLVLGETKTWKEALISIIPFIVYHSWSTYTAHLMASFGLTSIESRDSRPKELTEIVDFLKAPERFVKVLLLGKLMIFLQKSVVTTNRWSPCSSWHKHETHDMCEGPSQLTHRPSVRSWRLFAFSAHKSALDGM